MNNIGTVYKALGQWERALEVYERAQPIREEVGDRTGERSTRFDMAFIYTIQDQMTEAAVELKKNGRA